MITDRQVRQLRKLLAAGETLSRAAWKTGMDRKTAAKYRSGKLPSERPADHDWRTREDPFADVWDSVFEQLEINPELQAKTLFQWLQRTHPGRFQDGQLRTFQRGVKRWRATQGPPKEVFFRLVADAIAIGATHMGVLRAKPQSWCTERGILEKCPPSER